MYCVKLGEVGVGARNGVWGGCRGALIGPMGDMTLYFFVCFLCVHKKGGWCVKF